MSPPAPDRPRPRERARAVSSRRERAAPRHLRSHTAITGKIGPGPPEHTRGVCPRRGAAHRVVAGQPDVGSPIVGMGSPVSRMRRKPPLRGKRETPHASSSGRPTRADALHRWLTRVRSPGSVMIQIRGLGSAAASRTCRGRSSHWPACVLRFRSRERGMTCRFAGNTKPTQLRAPGKINTGITRTKRYCPAPDGTPAKMTVLAHGSPYAGQTG